MQKSGHYKNACPRNQDGIVLEQTSPIPPITGVAGTSIAATTRQELANATVLNTFLPLMTLSFLLFFFMTLLVLCQLKQVIITYYSPTV